MNAPKIPVAYPDAAVPIVAVARRPGRPARFHQHTGRDWEFCYVRSGQAQLRVGQAQWQLRVGDLLVVRPEEPHACVSWRGEEGKGNRLTPVTLI